MGKSQTSGQRSRRPLLVIDGDSFAHRAYHALPKSILRRGRIPAGAIVGFANMLLRLYREEKPRAVVVAWDTLEVPTYRHEEFSAYQSGREFDDALLEQLDALPEFVAACGFQNAKAPGFEADALAPRPGIHHSNSLMAQFHSLFVSKNSLVQLQGIRPKKLRVSMGLCERGGAFRRKFPVFSPVIRELGLSRHVRYSLPAQPAKRLFAQGRRSDTSRLAVG